MIVLTSAPVGQCNEAEILIYRLNNRKGDVYKQKYVFGGFESLIYKVSRNVYPESLDETINGILEDLLEGSGFTGAQLSQPLPNSMNSLQIRVARAYHASVFEKLKSLYMYLKVSVSGDILHEEGRQALRDGLKRVGDLMKVHHGLTEQYCALPARGPGVKFSKLPPELRERQGTNSEGDSDSPLPEMIKFLRLYANRVSTFVEADNEAETLIYKLNNRKSRVDQMKYVSSRFESLIYKVSRGDELESVDKTIDRILEQFLKGVTRTQLMQPPDVKTINTLQIRVARAYHASVYEKLKSLYMYLKPSVRGDILHEGGRQALRDGLKRVGDLIKVHHGLAEEYCALPTRGQAVKFSQPPDELRQRQYTDSEWRSDTPPPKMIDFLGQGTNPEWRSDTPPPKMIDFGNADEQELSCLDLSLGGNNLEGYKQTTIPWQEPSLDQSSIPQYALESSSYIHNDHSIGKRPMNADDPTCFHFAPYAHGGLASGSAGSTYTKGKNSKVTRLS
ncbi:hypothetical protein SeMB42_g04085 [Synchytrium endobioticum]|nr:hypothetical protein SeMB42_g04085 [Synchytrium endobioticum]